MLEPRAEKARDRVWLAQPPIQQALREQLRNPEFLRQMLREHGLFRRQCPAELARIFGLHDQFGPCLRRSRRAATIEKMIDSKIIPATTPSDSIVESLIDRKSTRLNSSHSLTYR